MKTQERPLDQDDLAMADLAEVADWSKIAGPANDEAGPQVVEALISRVSTATGWQPWSVEHVGEVDEESEAWGFTTPRGSTMIALNGLVLPNCPESGWSAFDLGPDDIPAAEAGLDEHWPSEFALATKHWGQPDYAGDDRNPAFENEWAPGSGAGRRHLAVWLREGAEFHLYSQKPTADPLSPAVTISYAAYLD